MENIADIKAELNSANQTIKSICDALKIEDGKTSSVVIQAVNLLKCENERLLEILGTIAKSFDIPAGESLNGVPAMVQRLIDKNNELKAEIEKIVTSEWKDWR